MTIRASIAELQPDAVHLDRARDACGLSCSLRRGGPTLAAGVTVPLSLAGAFALMWACGFTIDNLSLMAIVVAVGFVVDDAIVMIENIAASLERGLKPIPAAIAGARQIGFTVLSISLSLIAAFTPLLFMGGIIGRVFREFALTLAFAIAVSAVVSLTVTPMICGRMMRADNRRDAVRSHGRRRAGAASARPMRARSTAPCAIPFTTLAVFLLTIGLTVGMFKAMPKGAMPQDDTGLLFGWTEGASDVSFAAMRALRGAAPPTSCGADPGVASDRLLRRRRRDEQRTDA